MKNNGANQEGLLTTETDGKGGRDPTRAWPFTSSLYSRVLAVLDISTVLVKVTLPVMKYHNQLGKEGFIGLHIHITVHH